MKNNSEGWNVLKDGYLISTTGRIYNTLEQKELCTNGSEYVMIDGQRICIPDEIKKHSPIGRAWDDTDGNEQWRDVPGYSGKYQVSNYGRLKRGDKKLLGPVVELTKPGSRVQWTRDALKDIVWSDETWKTIPGFEGLYEISKSGLVKSLNYKGKGCQRILTKQTEIILFDNNGKSHKYFTSSLIRKVYGENCRK